MASPCLITVIGTRIYITKGCGCKAQSHCLAMAIPAVLVTDVNWIHSHLIILLASHNQLSGKGSRKEVNKKGDAAWMGEEYVCVCGGGTRMRGCASRNRKGVMVWVWQCHGGLRFGVKGGAGWWAASSEASSRHAGSNMSSQLQHHWTDCYLSRQRDSLASNQ